jgi:hypothetical protein
MDIGLKIESLGRDCPAQYKSKAEPALMVKAILISRSKLAVFKYKGFRLARKVFIYTIFEKYTYKGSEP